MIDPELSPPLQKEDSGNSGDRGEVVVTSSSSSASGLSRGYVRKHEIDLKKWYYGGGPGGDGVLIRNPDGRTRRKR